MNYLVSHSYKKEVLHTFLINKTVYIIEVEKTEESYKLFKKD